MEDVLRPRVKDSQAHEIAHGKHAAVDLIEGEPVFHLAFKASEHRARVFDEQFDSPAVSPAVEFPAHGKGHLIVAQGDQWLDAVFQALVDHIFIKLKALFIGNLLEAGWVNPGPVDGKAVAS